MAQYAHLSIPDPEWATVSATLPVAKPFVSIQAFLEEMAVIMAMRNSGPENKGPTEGLKVIETTVQVENGDIRVKAFIPDPQENEVDGFPLLIWMFGGGFVIGSIDDNDGFLRNLSVNSRIVCVAGDYRKAPEHPFPAAINDSYASLKWALSHSFELSVNVSKGLIIAGVSSGGNIAAVLTQRSLKDPELKGKVTGQLLLIPTLIAHNAYPEKYKSELLSFDKDEDKYILTKNYAIACSGKKQVLSHYTLHEMYHGGLQGTNPEVSPLLSESFEGLPPTYIQICGLDLLRDEAFLYEKLLKEAGVPTKVDVYPGLPHGFYASFPHFKASKKQKEDFVNGLDWALGRRGSKP
ncbi:hypothetical protein Clacol_007957 [Clathrus columnatus]|uniref:Alpha/beta hydrolase fold-3 domain-containing protein n=1 Tax=Clathrus columnatus TaxID=1419009 RepID=A0AAV5AMP8_9AGAM|nr:hypothetical protein Clacol_007957 [Clathrus columnatus]